MDCASKHTQNLHIEITEQAQQETRDLISSGLQAFNARHLGDYSWTACDVYVRDGHGRVLGGLIGDIALGWLAIHGLWVAEEFRGAGIGTEILKAAEAAAVEKGCRAAILDTLSFQAPAFYEKRGYERIGVVDDYRGGVQKIFMQKRLKRR